MYTNYANIHFRGGVHELKCQFNTEILQAVKVLRYLIFVHGGLVLKP